uniref:Uncharacterized protein n=1 Tax=Chromera velia CCMP2878 TaxID=1169474 RepID=A0A0G4F5F4_9ALVE|eukprot:Cvel_15320.t1-p1 / transcript=Cvel_15320.t1 / gene=Cvel_15320 / organism=Chromera_velia_CCMP2878 / gene_product=hypothetical protein / transcript_product=hypothetical protein / location=Cvel_scaffold1127:620-2067(+) / protein_length=338 / sequence_SO=supercontig / SO=protein_coding / is_pseudo=false
MEKAVQNLRKCGTPRRGRGRELSGAATFAPFFPSPHWTLGAGPEYAYGKFQAPRKEGQPGGESSGSERSEECKRLRLGSSVRIEESPVIKEGIDAEEGMLTVELPKKLRRQPPQYQFVHAYKLREISRGTEKKEERRLLTAGQRDLVESVHSDAAKRLQIASRRRELSLATSSGSQLQFVYSGEAGPEEGDGEIISLRGEGENPEVPLIDGVSEDIRRSLNRASAIKQRHLVRTLRARARARAGGEEVSSLRDGRGIGERAPVSIFERILSDEGDDTGGVFAHSSQQKEQKGESFRESILGAGGLSDPLDEGGGVRPLFYTRWIKLPDPQPNFRFERI